MSKTLPLFLIIIFAASTVLYCIWQPELNRTRLSSAFLMKNIPMTLNPNTLLTPIPEKAS